MQDWASSGVKKFDAAGGDSAWRDVALMIEDEVRGLMGANASTVDDRAIKMARAAGDALIFMFMVHCFLCWLHAAPMSRDQSAARPFVCRRQDLTSTWSQERDK